MLAAAISAAGCAPRAVHPVQLPQPAVTAEATPSNTGAPASVTATADPRVTHDATVVAPGATPRAKSTIERPATTDDLSAAKRAVLAREPDYARDYGPLRADLGTRADLVGAGWWKTHTEPPYLSFRLWAEVQRPDARQGEGAVRTWDVVKASPDAPWTVLLEGDISD